MQLQICYQYITEGILKYTECATVLSREALSNCALLFD